MTQSDCDQVLHLFVGAGHFDVDAATNYPIDGNPRSHGLALEWLAAWIAANPSELLRLNVKVGSLSNDGSHLNCLDPSFLNHEYRRLHGLFGNHLSTITAHWDNRTDPDEIRGTVEFFRELRALGLEVGLSGIRRPDLYRTCGNDLKDDWWIQVRETPVEEEERQRYCEWLPSANYIAYGINYGGFRPDDGYLTGTYALRDKRITPTRERELMHSFRSQHLNRDPDTTSLYEHAISVLHKRRLDAIIVAPRTELQASQVLELWQTLETA